MTRHVKLPSLFSSHILLAFIMPGEKPLNVILSNPMCLHMQIYLNEAFVLLLLLLFFYRCLFFFLFTNMSYIYKHYKDKLYYAAILIYCKLL